MFTIYKKEIASYFNSLLGYLAIGLFLLLNGLLLWFFPETSIFENGYATLDGFFSLAPYLLLFFVPAILMRSIAGEKADGTFDLLLSRPLSIRGIVLGKYFGGLTIAFLALLPTFIYAISIYYLAYPIGNIDIGSTIGSYVGLFLLIACFAAISIFCSALTKNSIIAFLAAVFACFLSFYAFDAVSKINFLIEYQDIIQNLGIQEHYNAVSRGVLGAKELFYFISFISLFLIITIGHINRKFTARKTTLTRYLITLLFIFFINQSFVTSLFDRIDFTEDNRFTLSKTTKEIIKNIEEDIYITIFLDGDLPSGFQKLKQATIDMAQDMKSYSKGKIKINLINPSDGNQQEQKELTDALIQRGLYPTNLSVKTESGLTQKLIFPAAIINKGEKEINVQLLQNRMGLTPEQVLNNSIQNLEYSFIAAIKKISKNESSYIGFTEGHDEPTDLQLYDAMHSLGIHNQVGRLNLDSIAFTDLDKLNIIIIAKPKTPFKESEKYKLDYFIRKGGSVIWAIDQIDADMQYLRNNGEQTLLGRELNLDDQLFLYGVKINYDIIADLNCSQIPLSVGQIGNQSQIELVPWYFFPIIMPGSQNPITKNLDGIRTEFINSLDTVASEGIKKEILLTSSPFTRILKTPSRISLQMVEEQPDPNKFKTKSTAFGILLSGNFPYLYENRPVPTGISEPKNLSNVSVPAKMFVIGDGDWLINQVNSKDESPFPLGWDRYTESQYANKTFLENIVDYLTGNDQLISLRNKEIKLRLLDKAKVKSEKIKWQIINCLAPLLALVVIALIQQYLRKRKYNKKAVI